MPSESDFDNPEVARDLNRPTECGAGLGQHRFRKAVGRLRSRATSGCVPGR